MRFMTTEVHLDGEERVSAVYLPAGVRGGDVRAEFMYVSIADHLSITGDPDAVVNLLRKAADLAAEKLAQARLQEMHGEAVAS